MQLYNTLWWPKKNKTLKICAGKHANRHEETVTTERVRTSWRRRCVDCKIREASWNICVASAGVWTCFEEGDGLNMQDFQNMCKWNKTTLKVCFDKDDVAWYRPFKSKINTFQLYLKIAGGTLVKCYWHRIMTSEGWMLLLSSEQLFTI